jgi:hypothetical protein
MPAPAGERRPHHPRRRAGRAGPAAPLLRRGQSALRLPGLQLQAASRRHQDTRLTGPTASPGSPDVFRCSQRLWAARLVVRRSRRRFELRAQAPVPLRRRGSPSAPPCSSSQPTQDSSGSVRISRGLTPQPALASSCERPSSSGATTHRVEIWRPGTRHRRLQLQPRASSAADRPHRGRAGSSSRTPSSPSDRGPRVAGDASLH